MPLTNAFLVLALAATSTSSTDAGPTLDVSRANVQTLDLPQDAVATFTVDAVLEGMTYRLRLERHSIRAPGFQAYTQAADGSLHAIAAPAVRTYRGTVDGPTDGLVVGSLAGGRLHATAHLDDGAVFHIQPLASLVADADPKQYAVYPDGAFEATHGRCGTTDVIDVADLAEITGGGRTARSGDLLELRIAFDADFEFFVLNQSSVDRTIQDIEMVMNGVSAIYEAEAGITFPISGIVVRTSEPDPYTSSTSTTLLLEFTDIWNASCPAPRELGHLFTGKDLQGGVVGQAYIGTACVDPENRYSLAYALSQSRFSNVLAERVAVTAHEIGHNLGATHCENHKSCGIMCGILGFCPIDTLGVFSVGQILEGAEPCVCPADIDKDGRVAVGDLLIILTDWGPCEGRCPGDVDNDCVVGFADLLDFLSAFGTTCPAGG